MKWGVLSLLVIFGCGLGITAFAQDKKPPVREENEVVRIETELVEVPVVVTDAAGRPLLNLKQNNFVVYEDGKTQELANFGAASAPFEVALLLDTSGSTRSDLQLIQRAAQAFIESLRPGDRVSIVAFGTKNDGDRTSAVVDVLASLTGDRTRLKAALERVSTSNGTPYYDGIVEIIEKVFGRAATDEFRGRRALVALTDGVDSTSIASFEEANEALERTGIIGYFIQVDTRPFFEEGLLGPCEGATRFSQAQIRRYYRSFGSRAKLERTTDFCRLGDFERLAISKKLYEIADSEMKLVATRSGGKVFPVGDLTDARNAFKNVASEIGTKYSLGYYSSNEKRDGTYRSIRVEVRGVPAGAQVRAREGYTAPVR